MKNNGEKLVIELNRLELLRETLLEIAERDCSASKILYEKGLFPQSVFMAEQCAEKVAKSLYITIVTSSLSGDMKDLLRLIVQVEKKLKNEVGHNAVKLIIFIILDYCVKMIKIGESLKKLGMENNVDFLELYGHRIIDDVTKEILECEKISTWIRDKKQFKVILEELREEQERIAKNDRLLVDLINELEKTFSIAEDFCNNIEDKTNEVQSKFEEKTIRKLQKLETLLHSITRNTVSKDEIDKALEEFYHIPDILRTIGRELYFLAAFLTIIKLYLLLFPHTTKTRYPENYNPIETYTGDMPLIRELNKILNLLERSIGVIKRKI